MILLWPIDAVTQDGYNTTYQGIRWHMAYGMCRQTFRWFMQDCSNFSAIDGLVHDCNALKLLQSCTKTIDTILISKTLVRTHLGAWISVQRLSQQYWRYVKTVPWLGMVVYMLLKWRNVTHKLFLPCLPRDGGGVEFSFEGTIMLKKMLKSTKTL